MISHTINSYQIPSQNKTKLKFQIWKMCQSLNVGILQKHLHATHLLGLLSKMCKYQMDLVSIVEVTERTDGQTDEVKPVYPPFNFVEAGGGGGGGYNKTPYGVSDL